MSSYTEKSPLYIPTDVANAISSTFFRPGQTIQGSIRVREDMLGTPDGFSQIILQLHTYYNLQAHTLKYEGRSNVASGGMVYSYHSDWVRHWDKKSDKVITSLQLFNKDTEQMPSESMDGDRRLGFSLVVPHDSPALRVAPTAAGNVEHEMYCVGVRPAGDNLFSNHVRVRLLPAFATPDANFWPGTPEFMMRGPWLPADNERFWESTPDGPSLSRRLLAEPSSTRKLLSKILPDKEAKLSKDTDMLDSLMQLYIPKPDLYPTEKHIPIVIEYRIWVPDWVHLERVSWDQFHFPLPGSGHPDEGRCQIAHWISSRVPKGEGGDGQVSRREHDREDLVTWSQAHLSDGVQGARVPRDTGEVFPLRGYGWSDPYQDPNNDNRWTCAAFVVGHIYAPYGTFERFTSADGNITTHSSVHFRQPRPDEDTMKGDPAFQEFAINLQTYCEFSSMAPPSYEVSLK